MIHFTYIPKDTAIHRLHPMTKFAWLASIGLLSFVLPRPEELAVLLFSVALVAVAAGVAVPWARFMRVALLPALIITVVNILMAPYGGERMMFASYSGSNDVLFSYRLGGVSFMMTVHSLQKGVFLGLRWLNVIAPAGVFIFTTKAEEFAIAIASLRVPYTYAFAVGMAFRLLPLVLEDTQTILSAQRARGLDWDGSLFRRFRAAPAIVIPLIACSIRRAVDMAAAMETRAYGASGSRTVCYPLVFWRRDQWLVAAFGVVLVVGLVHRFLGS
jgi:energy-coupling factor transport system permease protein